MQNIKLKPRGTSVSFLQELLGELGYQISTSDYFQFETDEAVKDFQMKSSLPTGQAGMSKTTHTGMIINPARFHMTFKKKL